MGAIASSSSLSRSSFVNDVVRVCPSTRSFLKDPILFSNASQSSHPNS